MKSTLQLVKDKLKEAEQLSLNIDKTEKEIYDLHQSMKDVPIYLVLKDAGTRSKILNQIKYKEDLLSKDRNKMSELLKEAQYICDNELVEFIDIDEIQKSAIFDFEALMTFIDSIDIFYRIAIFMLIFKAIIISSTISIVFVLYGDFLIVKYDIEKRFPKLAKIIQIRRRLQRYYLILSISWILLASFTEILFCISVLSV